MRLNLWNDKWDLNETCCPCDFELVEWAQLNQFKDNNVFHFGTGNHHMLGSLLCDPEMGNRVWGITASSIEYNSYMRLITDNPVLSHDYVVYFGDIYMINPKLFPKFDLITLFHAGEYRTEQNAEYGATDDNGLVDRMMSMLNPGGKLAFYTGSGGWGKTQPVVDRWQSLGALWHIEDFRHLKFYGL